MNRNNLESSDRLDGVLAQAVTALRDAATPAGPTAELDTRVAKALAAQVNPQTSLRITSWFRRPTRLIAGLAAMLVLAAGLAAIFGLFPGLQPTVAFADVVKKLLEVKTASFDLTTEVPGVPVQKAQTLYQSPFKMRMTIGDSVVISDMEKGKMVTLLPKNKKAIVVNVTDMPPEQQEQSKKGMFGMLQDQFQQALAGGSDMVEPLGRKQIHDRSAVGFRVKMPGQEIEAWVDPETALPVYLKTSMAVMSGTSTWENFAFNIPVDESQFDATPPADYSVMTMNVNASQPTEADLIDGLRIYCELTDGSFPEELELSVETHKKILQPAMKAAMQQAEQERKDGETAEQSKERATEATMVKLSPKLIQVQRGFTFAQMLPQESDWHYAGAGVKLNTPDTPLFWYKPKDATLYRVIYADLSVKDLPADQLPKPSAAE